jgi:hypothetical protein
MLLSRILNLTKTPAALTQVTVGDGGGVLVLSKYAPIPVPIEIISAAKIVAINPQMATCIAVGIFFVTRGFDMIAPVLAFCIN